jgi:ABC-2 type transport system permease protein
MRPRPFYWSVRRELWEHRSIYWAPLAVAAVVLAGFLLGAVDLPEDLRQAMAGGADFAVTLPYYAAAAGSFAIGFLVLVFYCLGAFHGERRDRSMLFWKSLPVSDTTTVFAKAAIPLAVQPAILFVVIVATQLVLLTLGVAVLLASGDDPTLLWGLLHLPTMWVMLPYGLVVTALWNAPIYGWLLLVSAWAKRATFVWAVAPWLLLALFEFLAFRTRRVWDFLGSRLFDGLGLAYSVGGQGRQPISSLSQVDPMVWLREPGLWGGLAFAAACLAGCVWLRRRHDPA